MTVFDRLRMRAHVWQKTREGSSRLGIGNL
jgi:hypothetical protein